MHFLVYFSLGASLGVWGRGLRPLSDPTGPGQPTSPPRNIFIFWLYMILGASFRFLMYVLKIIFGFYLSVWALGEISQVCIKEDFIVLFDFRGLM